MLQDLFSFSRIIHPYTINKLNKTLYKKFTEINKDALLEKVVKCKDTKEKGEIFNAIEMTLMETLHTLISADGNVRCLPYKIGGKIPFVVDCFDPK